MNKAFKVSPKIKQLIQEKLPNHLEYISCQNNRLYVTFFFKDLKLNVIHEVHEYAETINKKHPELIAIEIVRRTIRHSNKEWMFPNA